MIIKIKKSDAIGLLQEHKEAYVKDYAETCKIWEMAVENQQDVYQKWIKGGCKGEEPDRYPPDRPIDRTAEYDKLIKALKLHSEDTIDLDEKAQNIIIHDKLSWKAAWIREKAPIYTMGSPDSREYQR